MTTKKKLVMSYNITKKMDDQMIGLIRDGHYEIQKSNRKICSYPVPNVKR